jgi:hypothetical protein
MSPEEKQLRMVMLDWPQEKVAKYNQLRDELYNKWITDITSFETEDDREVYMCAFAIANIKLGNYAQENF